MQFKRRAGGERGNGRGRSGAESGSGVGGSEQSGERGLVVMRSVPKTSSHHSARHPPHLTTHTLPLHRFLNFKRLKSLILQKRKLQNSVNSKITLIHACNTNMQLGKSVKIMFWLPFRELVYFYNTFSVRRLILHFGETEGGNLFINSRPTIQDHPLCITSWTARGR